MRSAIRFYTEVLDFVMTCPDDTPDSPVVDLGHEEIEFQITTHERERLFGSVAYVYGNDVDALFAKFKRRGLDTRHKTEFCTPGPRRSNLGPPRILRYRCRW